MTRYFEVTDRDCAARIGKLMLDHRKTWTYWARHGIRAEGLKRLTNDSMRTSGNDENNGRSNPNREMMRK